MCMGTASRNGQLIIWSVLQGTCSFRDKCLDLLSGVLELVVEQVIRGGLFLHRLCNLGPP